MFFNRARSLPDLCARVGEAVDRLDMKAAAKATQAVAREMEGASAAELTEGVTRLVPAVKRVAIGNGAGLAQLMAGMIEAGSDPLPVLDVLVERITDGLEQAARFPALAREMGGNLTAPTRPAEADALLRRTAATAMAFGIDAYEAGLIMQACLTVNEWIPGLLLPLQQKRARKAVRGRQRLIDAAAAMVDHADDATWLLGLLHVLDDEHLIVVHRVSGAAYELSVSGIGDNFQLHTLLSAMLIGDPAAGLIPGERPEPARVAAATSGNMTPPTPIQGQFNLVSATGEWIWNEGRPADIPVVGGHRVIVLDPPPYRRTWNIGRAYPLMAPEISLERILPRDESAAWARRILPAEPTS
jgi:hypothetical protein